MSADCLVSVIVPIYNREKYLNRCVNSILAQTHQNLEVILVDDGSKDSSGTICDEYAKKDTRIKAIHIPNGGVSNARNTGIDNATGKYIFFVDSDDYIMPTHIEGLIPNDEEDYVYGGYRSVCDGEEIVATSPKCKTYDVSQFFKMDNFPKMISFPSSLWIGAYKRELIINKGLRLDTTLSIAEDQLFNLHYLKNCKRISSRNVKAYCYDKSDHSSLIGAYHANRLQSVKLVNAAQEEVVGRILYAARWDNWHMGLAHYQKWKKIGDKETKKSAMKMLKTTYKDEYFIESINYMRSHGSMDEKVETYFMGYYKHIWYKPCYGCIKLLSKIKKFFRRRKNGYNI